MLWMVYGSFQNQGPLRRNQMIELSLQWTPLQKGLPSYGHRHVAAAAPVEFEVLGSLPADLWFVLRLEPVLGRRLQVQGYEDVAS